MQLHDIIIISVFSCLTVALILLKLFNVGNRRRGAVKMLASAIFLVLGILGCVNHDGGYAIMLLVGLFFAFLGDLFLVFMDKRRWFVAGVLSFSMAGLILSVYSVINYGWQWWSLLIFALLVVANVLAQVFKVYGFGSSKVYLNVYTVLVSACGSLGFMLLCQGVDNLPMFLFGLGCFMYLTSDILLGLYMFKLRNRFVDAANTLLYFPGMLLIALSLLV